MEDSGWRIMDGRLLLVGKSTWRLNEQRQFLPEFSREFEQKVPPFAQKSCVFHRIPSHYRMTTL